MATKPISLAIIALALSNSAHAATTPCPASYSIDVGPVLDCEVGSQRRYSMGTYDASIVNSDEVFGLNNWSTAFNSTYTQSEYSAMWVNDNASNLNGAVSVMLVWTPFDDATVNESNYVAFLLPRNGASRTDYFDPFDYASGGHFGAQQYGVYKSVSSVPAVPIPAAVWLFGSGLLGLVGVARKKKS